MKRIIDYCPKCGAGTDEPAGEAPDIEKRPFKPYANISSPSENDLYKMLVQAFSETNPRQRPWCGVGVEVGLLAVSPTNLTAAAIKEVIGVQQAVVHVPQNWREPWYVESPDGARHQAPDNPCDQAERAISTIKHSLGSFLAAGDQSTFPSIKYLILFPDGYTFEGTKEFFIMERDGVLTLNLRNFRELAEAISAPTQQPRLDSRKYRAWIEGRVLKKSDDSIVGTWLDPAFDKVEAEPAKRQRWRFRYLRPERASAEEKALSSSANLQAMPMQQKFRLRQSKLPMTAITGMIIGITGWWLYDATKPQAPVSQSNSPLTPPRAQKSINGAEVTEAAIPPSRVSLPGNEDGAEVRKTSAVEEPELKKQNQVIERVRKPRDPTQATEDSELKRQKIELQIDEAIRLRAISGVTVHFVGETAHLKGKVDTASQKSAAEKAARGIRGVKKVHSSIEVNFLQ
ncbi:MAG TPA: BON domain-containing protein [Candidatus Binatia bacterium]|nr:BON domain-containing protein [Candidatus Binatia bacterium]